MRFTQTILYRRICGEPLPQQTAPTTGWRLLMKIFYRILTWLYAVFGGFVFLCFGSYFIKLLFAPEGTLPLIISSLAAIISAAPVLFRKSVRKALKKAYIPLKAIMCAGFLFYFATFTALVLYIYNPQTSVKPDEVSGNTVYIVFGAKINPDAYPTATLKARLDAAYDALDYNKDGICIVSGGKGEGEPQSEGSAMKEYLVSRGIEESRIFTEEKSRNTAENIRYSKKLIQEQNLEDYAVVCVSSNTHIPRIRLLCEDEGLESKFIKADFPKMEYLPANLVREYLSYSKMFLIGY